MTAVPAHRDGLALVTLYTKPGCHLCDDALATLRRLSLEIPFELIERDITDDEDLHRAYFERIPVIALDGEELFDYFVDEALLRERLAGRVHPASAEPGAAPAGGGSERRSPAS